MEQKNKKLFKRGLIALLASGAIIAAVPSWIFAKRNYCSRFYEKMNKNCRGISELGDYIDYDMLSSDLKKLIDEDDFKFASDKEKFAFCEKYKDMDYNYERKGSSSDYYPTDKSSLYDKLAQRIIIDGETYDIYVSLVFKTGTFLRPEIVDLDTSAFKTDGQQ